MLLSTIAQLSAQAMHMRFKFIVRCLRVWMLSVITYWAVTVWVSIKKFRLGFNLMIYYYDSYYIEIQHVANEIHVMTFDSEVSITVA